jgi:hypothetical protein
MALLVGYLSHVGINLVDGQAGSASTLLLF